MIGRAEPLDCGGAWRLFHVVFVGTWNFLIRKFNPSVPVHGVCPLD